MVIVGHSFIMEVFCLPLRQPGLTGCQLLFFLPASPPLSRSDHPGFDTAGLHPLLLLLSPSLSLSATHYSELQNHCVRSKDVRLT